MKKTLTSLFGLSTLAIASPAFADHGEHTGLFANIAHWLSSPAHGLLSLAAIAAFGIVAIKLANRNTQA